MHAFFESVAKALGMCGYGRDLNWWVRVADWFFVDCACCLFWRGVAVGTAAASSAIGVLAVVWSLIAASTAEPPSASPYVAAQLAGNDRRLALLEAKQAADSRRISLLTLATTRMAYRLRDVAEDSFQASVLGERNAGTLLRIEQRLDTIAKPATPAAPATKPAKASGK